jgi:hypothetical protein
VNPAGVQCVNIAGEWLRVNGAAALTGDAHTYVGRSSGAFHWHSASPGFVFHVGDLLVWDVSTDTPLGHVALCMDGSQSDLVSLDVDYPLGSCAHIERHPKGPVSGVLRLHT